jgi:hypothetical protein
MTQSRGPTVTQLLLAFRQAKNAIASEKGVVGLLDLARFETRIATRLRRLQARLGDDRWFEQVPIGRVVVMPKSAKPASMDEPDEVTRIGHAAKPKKVRLDVRIQLEPTPEFTITEVLYLWEFGGALEATLDDSCVGYRLRRVVREGKMDWRGRHVYEHWPTQFARYRDDPIKAARTALKAGKHVVVTSTDIVTFFDSIDPSFLLTREFVRGIAAASRRLGRPFVAARYRSATRSLLRRFAEFRDMRRKVGGAGIDTATGVPIGALTSRLFANVALASLDAHIQAIPTVLCYRRYVDDIVIVSAHETALLHGSKAAALAATFPGFARSPDESQHRFVVPNTGAVFALSHPKTLVHELVGESGVHFLDAVRQSFSAVTSERRAFAGDVNRLTADIESIDLFGESAAGAGHIPRLRDADRFSLRRLTATVYIRGLERCALLLDRVEASNVVRDSTRRMLVILEASEPFENFEIVVSLLKVGLMCDCREVVETTRAWLARHSGGALASFVESVSWRGTKLTRGPSLRAVGRYLERRVFESSASALETSGEVTSLADSLALAKAAQLLRCADLRHLDREDDHMLFGPPGVEVGGANQPQYVAIRLAILGERVFERSLASVSSFIDRSLELGERVWLGVSEVSLVLSFRPPKYADIARRFLARVEGPGFESSSTLSSRDIGRSIDDCVDAVRGTRYGRRSGSFVSLKLSRERATLRLGASDPPSVVRVILANLPVSVDSFRAAAAGAPRVTLERLRALDTVLRAARHAAQLARRVGRPALLVLPELAVPRRWVRALGEYSAGSDLGVVAGVEYEVNGPTVVSQAMGVFPAGWYTAAVVRWTKQHPARHEEVELQLLGKRFPVFPRMIRRLVVESAMGRVGVLICSELLETAALAAISGHVELLAVPAWNDDTPSFEHVAHAAAGMLVHSFVCIANNAEASDSRITAPIGSPRWERDWCRLIHRGETQVIWGDLPVAELRAIHEAPTIGASPASAADVQSRKRKYRPMPPGWNPL